MRSVVKTMQAVQKLPADKIKYINNDKKRGIQYNYNLIRKTYNRLGIPDHYFNPTKRPFDICKYLIDFSRRGTGKTTGLLLLGLVFHWLYGTHTIYVRQTENEIAPKFTSNLYDVIKTFDYISILTENKWNSITYYRRRFYLCNVDENGTVIEKSSDYCTFLCDVNNATDLKSSYNDPLGDIIIYDEFINENTYLQNEFVRFCDLVSTIVRQRYSPIVWMLSNNIDKMHPFFYEMECAEIVHSLQPGQYQQYTTERGTMCFVEYYSPEVMSKKSNKVLETMNKLFFGFKNKKLGSITGEDWSITPVQHIPINKDITFIVNNLYIYAHEKYVKLDIIYDSELGVCVYVHWATRTYDDSIILTIENRYDSRYVYGAGTGKLNRILTKCLHENRFYYASNDISAFVRRYFVDIPDVV